MPSANGNGTAVEPLSIKLALPNGVTYNQPTGLFINNEFVKSSTEEKITVIDPATEKEIAAVYAASPADIDTAVAAARKAFKPWKKLPAAKRGDYLLKLTELIDRDRELFAAIDAWDNGKTYEEALTIDMEEAYHVFKYYSGFADKIFGKTIETHPQKLTYCLQEPLGVCAQIIPWNYPFMMLAWKVAPAIACGNTVVIKSSELTPLSVLYFGKLIQQAGIPAGVINIVSGLGGVAGAAMAGHMDVDKVAFTGSTATGKKIMAAASNNLKSITLECGGKSPSLVFKDCDLEQTVKWTYLGAIGNQGEVCSATTRIYVEDDFYDTFMEAFVAYTKEMDKVGLPFEEGNVQGAQVSEGQFNKVMAYIEKGNAEGAKLYYGGERRGTSGYFISPTVFGDITEDMTIVKEEIFGPVVVIGRFSDVDDAVEKANNTVYGLAAAVFTENITRAHQIAADLEAGVVWINESNDCHFGIPFGGVKQTGFGREMGPYAMDMYTHTKAVQVNLGANL
ncbi:hypothetical protein SEUCBS139899_009307 [Sporothrix eucalyptigena]|uniref:aldehyde dehydrogenase (NAD(+)) n=1 Tax=Sporothrix eucalyptigena TaxID=1812306 RepID=A0ABP0CTE9_9PEZI